MPQQPDREEVRQQIKAVRSRYHIRAPELPTGFQWLNVKRPLTADDLRGKVVLLDFWTYCCINCMHVLPDLRYLEKKYAGEAFAVIGVHSAKFSNEQDAENIRQAILRYGIEHPVVVDQNYKIWQSYGTRAWPTMVLVDPDGYISAVFSGEGHREELDTYISVLLEEFDKQAKLEPVPLPIDPEMTRRPLSVLNFPGKVLADSAGKRLYISDSNHNRILVTDMDGNIRLAIGSGEAGFRDGSFADAAFLHPQGLAVYRDKLLIADTDNHAIREADFAGGTVRTIAGSGAQGAERAANGPAAAISLNSPWDLQVVGDQLYIAMAGFHQIWRMDLTAGTIDAYAGSGREARQDGPRRKAAFAQPSGLAYDGRYLYVADSEISSVRVLDLQNKGAVSTVAGGDLFDFGDRDGTGDEVRLQHPLGIAAAKGRLYLADTYNHKIKIIDPEKRQVKTYLGTGTPGLRDGRSPQFYEPSGITVYRDTLYIADTNNQRIRVVHLSADTASTLQLKGLEKLAAQTDSRPVLNAGLSGAEMVKHAPHTVHPGKITLQVHIQLPAGQKFNPESPFQYLLAGDKQQFDSPALNRIQSLKKGRPLLEIPLTVRPGAADLELKFELLYFYCDDAAAGTCKIRSVTHRLPLSVSDAGEGEIQLTDQPPQEL